MESPKYPLRAIAFAFVALATVAPAAASAADEPRTEKVYFGDLDLASPAGIETLDRRLDRAVERVCGQASVRELQKQRQIKKCRQLTWNSVRSDRQVAIARADKSGVGGKTWAENGSGGQAIVARAE